MTRMIPAPQIVARYVASAAILAAFFFLGMVLFVEPNKALAQSTVTYQFCVWDTEAEDGDKINLDIDNRRILTNHELFNEEHCVRVPVTLRQATSVTVTTTDDGNPPNTSAIRIRSDGRAIGERRQWKSGERRLGPLLGLQYGLRLYWT